MTRARDVSNTQASSGGPVPPMTAGKNVILNGDFNIWQRGTSFSPSTFAYTADRWQSDATLAYPTSRTISRQSFTPGTAPVAGYEGAFFLRCVYSYSPGNPGLYLSQKIEDVRTFAGQTITVSFWAKVGSTASLDNATIVQNFGTGGSTAVQTTVGAASATTSWQRFSFTVSIPSIAGKTIGTDSNLELRIFMPNASSTTDIWGVQLEAGPVATPFETATGTIQGELAACQRYYIRSTPGTAYAGYGTGMSGSSTSSYVYIPFPVSLRLQPQAVEYSTLAISDGYAYVLAISNLALNHSTPTMAALMATHASGATTARTALICNNNSTSGYIGFTAEL